MIDLSSGYTLEPKLTKGDLQGLDKEGLSKHVGTSMFLFAKYNPRTNKFTTGLDINSRDVLSLPEKERVKKQQEIAQVKESLESYFGKPGLLDANSPFWDEFGITITTGQNKETYIELEGKVFDLNPTENPLHKLALIMLDANDYLPKSRKEAGSPKYKDAKFLLTTNQEIEKDAKENVRKEIARGNELFKLFGDNVNYERAWEICFYMGLNPKFNVSAELLQQDLYMVTKVPSELDKFLKACTLSNEDLLIANMVKQGIQYDLIRYNGEIKLYTYGAANLRDTEDGSIEYLKSPAMATVLAQLREAVDKRKKKKNPKSKTEE
jgi:hypothetical protein